MLLIKQATLINEGKQTLADVLIEGERIVKIDSNIDAAGADEIDAEGSYLLPGIIDDQVHFREPGLTHKADIYSESRAAVAGGVTSFMEMPNTKPPAISHELLEEKYQTASSKSLANFSFFMGVSNDNLDEVLKTNSRKNDICGIKIFMGSSTGNMLVDDYNTLNGIFKQSELLIATHCEDEHIIAENRLRLSDSISETQWTAQHHPIIRNAEACFSSSSEAINLAQKHGSRLHILHISTAKELELFQNNIPLQDKQITSEVCVHHLSFTSDHYGNLGNLIKCNPAIKAPQNKTALWEALLDDRLDIVATDHAPHTLEEKQHPYYQAPAGVPLVQHSLLQMLEHSRNGKITLQKVIDKMCHAPAICFQIKDRGYIREGYYADLVLVDPTHNYKVTKDNIYYKCGWSPWEGKTFSHTILKTIVNGHIVYANGEFDESHKGKRLEFNRK